MLTRQPFVGMKVKLSPKGYESMHLTSEQEFEDAKTLTITDAKCVGGYGTGINSEVWDIRVDKPSINQFMLCQVHLLERE